MLNPAEHNFSHRDTFGEFDRLNVISVERFCFGSNYKSVTIIAVTSNLDSTIPFQSSCVQDTICFAVYLLFSFCKRLHIVVTGRTIHSSAKKFFVLHISKASAEYCIILRLRLLEQKYVLYVYQIRQFTKVPFVVRRLILTIATKQGRQEWNRNTKDV